jgi:hypothetical protein
MLALLVNSFFPPAERGAAFYGFYNQFMQALGQSNLPQPETIEGDPVIFRELHEAAYKARTLLKDNWKLLQALGLRLLEVREMSGDELTAFLKLQTSPT